MKFEEISVDDVLADTKPEMPIQADAEKTGLDFSSISVDDLIAEQDKQGFDAASAVTAKTPEIANRERIVAEKMQTTRVDAEYNLDALEKQNESNEIEKVLREAPALTNHLANNQADAPILRNDLGLLRDVEQSFGKYGIGVDENGELELLANAQTGWQAAREDVAENASAGFVSGKAMGELGVLMANVRDKNLEITEDINKSIKEYEKQMEEMSGRDSFIADAAQIVGTMYSALMNSANETAALSGGVVAAGMATGIGTPVASTLAGAMIVGGSLRAMYDIEGGLAYKEMIDKGADPEKAKLISQGVGLVNSLIEFGGVTLLGKAFAPVLRTLTTKYTAKTATALSEASMLSMISESSKAMVKSVGAEVTTEVMQELVNIAGEGLANEYANAQFDEKTLESVYDRLSEIAIKTAKGMFVLGSLGMAPAVVAGSRKVYEARKAEEFFTSLSEGMSKSEAAQVAPEVMAGVVQQMAEDAKTGVVYVDAAELQQVLADNNVTLEQLEEVVPGVSEVFAQKVLNKEDIVLPTGQYAAKIAGTDLGKALTPHVRLSENALSVADAVKLRNEQKKMLTAILEGKVSEEDIDQDILQITKVSQAEIDSLEAEYDEIKGRMKGTKDEERKALQEEAKAMRKRIQDMKANMRVGFVAEYEALKAKMFEQIKETGVYNEAEAKTNAKYGAWLVTNLARRAGLKPERIAELAPTVLGERKTNENTLLQNAYEASLAEDAKAWAEEVDKHESNRTAWMAQQKSRTDLPFLRQLPLVFVVAGAKPKSIPLRISSHVFDGTHPEITPEILKGLPEALANPIAIFKSATRTNVESYVVMVELHDAKNATVVVPVEINAVGAQKRVLNIVRTVFPKNRVADGEPVNEWFAEQSRKGNLLYADRNKLSLWRSFAGSTSHWDLSKGLNGSVPSEEDLRKLREKLGNKFYQTAWHGTPHEFDEFSLGHIGSGEGAQAHGWGLYFALSRPVAEGYRKRLSNNAYQADQIVFDYVNTHKFSRKTAFQWYEESERMATRSNVRSEEYRYYRDRQALLEAVLMYEHPDNIIANAEQDEYDANAIAWFKKTIASKYKPPVPKQEGRLFEVDIPDNEVLLDEEKRIGEQTELVKNAVSKFKKIVTSRLNELLKQKAEIESTKERSIEEKKADLEKALAKVKDKLSQEDFDLLSKFENYRIDNNTTGAFANDVIFAGKGLFYLKKLRDQVGNEIWNELNAATKRDERSSQLKDINNAIKDNEYFLSRLDDKFVGADFYNMLARFYRSPKAASEWLNGEGIKGIYYVGEVDGPCVVVFDDKAIKVLEFLQKNQADQRGSFSITSNQVTLTPNADLSTFAHEMGHWYLETLFAIYDETTSASVRSDVEVMLKDFGLKSIDDWKALSFEEREVLHERFAFYVEQYLAEGKAPTKETQGFFKRFGAWIRGVYSRFGKGAKEELNNIYRQRFEVELPEMSEEVRRVLDRMVAAEEAVKTAEQAEGIVPLFKQKPADMTDEQWEELMQERDDAYAEATDAAFARMARDEKWYSNARSRKLKEVQQQADEVKNIVRDKVEKELDAKAESKAFNMVKLGGLKMDPELLKKEGFDYVTIDALKKGGLCKRGGMSPTAVRELVRAAKSYHTTKRMIAEFVTLSDREKLIDELVTKRCLRDYSELFNTKKRDAIISKALHNEARGRMVATELSYLANDKEGRSRIYREAARRTAEKMINEMPVGSVSVRKFVSAEARASRKAYDALQKGDRYAAVLAKRAQLVQHEAALMAIEIEAEMRRIKSLKDRVFKADKKIAKTHDIDIINIARYVLTNEGLGKGSPSSGTPSDALKFVKKLEQYDPDKFALFSNFIQKHGYKGDIEFSRYTVSYAMEVFEDVQMLYRMAREAKTLTLDGKRIDREEAVNELVGRFSSAGREAWDGGKERILPASGRLAFAWMSLKSKMIRVEQWCHAMDGEPNGPFFTYIYLPIANAAAKYRNLNNKAQEALVKVLKPMVNKWSDVREIEAPEVGYTFATKAELIGALLHTGNESNKNKMLLGGRGEGKQWARLVELQDGTNFVDTTQWDSFVARAMQNGIITKEDMDVVQQIWDLTESTKPVAQAAFKAMYGTYFEEVEATEVVTPWGNYRGGYVPAITDKYLVAEKQTQEEAKRITEQDFVSQMPVHQPGFSKSRVPNYTKPLALNVGLLCGHVQEVLKFAVMAPVAQEVAKIISDKRFTEVINKHDQTLVSQVLVPWLKRSYEQTVSDGKTDMFSSKLNQLRGIAGMNIMAGHVVNALQQWTGLSIAATKVKPTYMAKALADLVKHKSRTEDVIELSPFMKARLNDRAFEFQSQIERIAKTSENVKQAKGVFNKAVALDEKLDAARDWASRHGYFLQTAMQAPIDTIVWLGAYNQSIDEGMSAEDAIANADSIVRTTQSAFDPESVASVETGGAFYRCFLVFYNYFNMQLNLLGESWEGAKYTKKYGKFALDAMFIVAIPSILSAILTQMLSGFDAGDDEEYDAYDAMRLLIAEPIKNVLAMAPFLGNIVTAGGTVLANTDLESAKWAKFIWGEDPYQGRMMNSPAFDALATGGTGILQWMKAAEDEDFNARGAVRGTLDLLSVATRLPLGALKKPGGWVAGYLAGDIEPESTSEVIRGLLSGKDVSK